MYDGGRFSNLNSDMMEVLFKLSSSQNLCKLLYYNDENPLSKPDITNTRSLWYNYIYPYRYIPEIQTDLKCLLTFSFGEFRSTKGNEFKAGSIIFNIICHKDLVKVNYGSRLFCMMNEIDKLFNDQSVASLFKLTFDRSDELFVNKDYPAYYIKYKTFDFN